MASVHNEIKLVYSKAERSLEKIKQANLFPEGEKTSKVEYPIGVAAQMVGKSRQSVLNAESSGIIPERPMKEGSRRRRGFSLEQVHTLQDHFGTRQWREPEDDTVIIAVQNFKGGVGKSTQACSLAHFLAEKGYRVLLVDADSQGSTTATFGYLPDRDFVQDNTLFPFFDGNFDDGRPCEDIRYAIRKQQQWHGLDLVPSNLTFYNSEYVIASHVGTGIEPLTLLANGIHGVSGDYDVVIIDSPPALGFISLNVLAAANAYLIPTPPGLYDYMSTIQFLSMLYEIFEKGIMKDKEINFLKILPTRVESNPVERTILDIMRHSYGDHLMKNVIPNSTYIKEASNLMTTVYEMPGIDFPNDPKSKRRDRMTSKTGYKTARKAMDNVNNEIEDLILSTRSSRINRLIKEAV